MSPEINYLDKQGKRRIISVPDVTGTYDTDDGALYVDVDCINAFGKSQRILLEGMQIGGKRVVGLTLEGKGTSLDPKRGDQIIPEIYVLLNERPIRVSYQDSALWEWREGRGGATTMGGTRNRGWWENVRPAQKRSYRNPYWMKNGRR